MLNPDPVVFETELGQVESLPPQVFSRAFTVPAGMPWVQMRAARLEVRHGAPLPITELLHQVRRLGAWSPGRPARFAAFYLRSREFHKPFETSLEIEGQTLKVAFGAAGEQFERAQRVGVLAAIGGLALVILLGGIGMSLKARSEVDTQTTQAEQQLATKVHAFKTLQRRTDQAQALKRAVGRARPVSDVLTALSWASASKSAEARIVAVHWDHGLLAVEVRGETAPFIAGSRTVERSPRPIRNGVWLWGVQEGLGFGEVGP